MKINVLQVFGSTKRHKCEEPALHCEILTIQNYFIGVFPKSTNSTIHEAFSTVC